MNAIKPLADLSLALAVGIVAAILALVLKLEDRYNRARRGH